MKKITRIERTIPKSTKRLRVAAYARVSLASEKLLHSLSAQVSYYSEFIQSNPTWEYAGVYVDEGISGTSIAKRLEFQRLIADCEAGKIDMVLVKSLSRMSRNTLDLLNTVRRLKEIGVEVRFERENISTTSEDGELLLTLLASFAQSEAESVSENVKWGKRKGFAQGNVNGMQAPYGYRWQGDTLVIVPEEAAVVRRIYREYLCGRARTGLADDFNAEGMTTRTGTPWGHSGIRYILSNPIYTGDILLQKTYITNPFAKKQKWNKGELPQYLIKDAHEPIVSREDFIKAQEEQKRRGELGIFAYDAIPTSCFTQKLECGKCHSVYHRDKGELRKDGTRLVYWVCYGSFPCRKEQEHICDAGRFLTQEELVACSCKVLGLEEFDENVFLAKVSKIIVTPQMLEFHLASGETSNVPLNVKPSRIKRKPPTEYSFWTGKIKCEVCGGNYISQKKHYVDGSWERYWICGSGKNCEGRKTGLLWENMLSAALGDEKKNVEFITAGPERTLTAHLKDGTQRILPWPKRKRRISKKEV